MKIVLFLISIFGCSLSRAQGSPPWEHPLQLANSIDGTAFSTPVMFQDSAGVPSLIRWKGDTLVCAFQWFRKPLNSITWDRVAVKFSYNAGVSWTAPVPIAISGMAASYQRPFDPTLAVVNKSTLRIYFSSSVGTSGGPDSNIDTYSAITSNGVNYTFEANSRFDHPTSRVIDPAVILFNGVWQYAAPIGAPQDGAYHATSHNGLDFVQQSNYPSDASHNWTGNFMINNPGELRFYGSGQRIWFVSSSDGNSWQGYSNTNIQGGDPSVIRINNSNYLAIFVGQQPITEIPEDRKADRLFVYPNPVTDYINITGESTSAYRYSIYSITGELITFGNRHVNENISTTALTKGLYILRVECDWGIRTFKIIKSN